MQNDYNPQYQLTIETHEGLKLSHALNDDEVKVKGDLFIWDEHLEKEIEIDPKHFLKGSTS